MDCEWEGWVGCEWTVSGRGEWTVSAGLQNLAT